MRNGKKAIVAVVVLAAAAAVPVRAGMFENVVEGLRFAGFTVDGNHDAVSNSTVGVITRNLQGNTIDLGDVEFALQGPLTAMVQTGGRSIPTLDVILSTGRLNVNPNQVTTVGAAEPLAYNATFDSGLNTTSIDGNLLGDARFSINTFGSYDLRLQFSDRQTTTIDGQFSDQSPIDRAVDLGPIDIEGNIFADLLAVVTDPLFELSGTQNIFAQFSGRTFAKQELEARLAELENIVAAGGLLSQDDLAQIAGLSLATSVLGGSAPDLGFLADARIAPADASSSPPAAAVPEPSTLLLLVAGAALVVSRRRLA